MCIIISVVHACSHHETSPLYTLHKGADTGCCYNKSPWSSYPVRVILAASLSSANPGPLTTTGCIQLPDLIAQAAWTSTDWERGYALRLKFMCVVHVRASCGIGRRPHACVSPPSSPIPQLARTCTCMHDLHALSSANPKRLHSTPRPDSAGRVDSFSD